MTREEAKRYIIQHCNPDYPNGSTEWETAMNMAIEALQQPKIVRCKECMYAPTGDSVNHHLEFPDDTGICPCQCLDDNWYSWKPDDNFYCGHGKMKEGEVNAADRC